MPPIPKQVTTFIRRRVFLEKLRKCFTKSERRQFERDVYDFAEVLGLDHAAAKRHVINARSLCGEENYDSDNSALPDEVNDSAAILSRVAARSGSEPVVLPSIEDAERGQAKSQRSAKASPKKSPYFVSSSKMDAPKKKRKRDSKVGLGAVEKEPPKSPKRLKDGKEDSTTLDDLQCASQGFGDSLEDRKTMKGANPSGLRSADISSKAHVVDESKASRKSGRRARRAKARAERDAQSNTSQERRLDALEPKSKIEAHDKFFRANEQYPHEHGSTLDKAKEERAQSADLETAFVKNPMDDIQSSYDKQVDFYLQGHMKKERKEVKDDLQDLKESRDYVEDAEQRGRKAQGKKGKSEVKGLDQKQGPAIKSHSKKKGEVAMKSCLTEKESTKQQIKEDFLDPMIQQA